MSNANPLSEALRTLRKAAGLSGAEAARRAGITQSKISRAETGLFLPNVDEIRSLCRIYNAPAEARQQLLEMARELTEGTTPARVVLQRGGWWMQERIGKLEAAASTIRTFTPAVIIGLLQSPAYIDALFGDSLPAEERKRTVQARLDRQMLLQTPRQFSFVMAEGALRWNMGGGAVMVEQLKHLTEISHRENVRLGVIPWTTPARVPAVNGFTIYDSRAVLIGTQTATAIITDQQNVRDYEAHWAELEPLVSWNDDARSVISRIADDYRKIV
jgi:transcriptional regulator with XRE-family HTH domain